MATTNSNSAALPHSFASYLYRRSQLGNKYSSGRLLVDAGSNQFPGAALLAVGGARRGGAGYINYLSRAELPTHLLLQAFPDVVPITDPGEINFDAVLVGPGSPAITELPKAARVIIDGGALTFVKNPPPNDQIWVLTPHEGEIKRMGFDPRDREECAITAARALRAVILLKGFNSIVATPDRIVHIDHIAGPELSTAGTGDVLAGLIASMIASHKPESLDMAATITAHAAEILAVSARSSLRKRAPLVATDLLDEIPMLLAQGETSL